MDDDSTDLYAPLEQACRAAQRALDPDDPLRAGLRSLGDVVAGRRRRSRWSPPSRNVLSLRCSSCTAGAADAALVDPSPDPPCPPQGSPPRSPCRGSRCASATQEAPMSKSTTARVLLDEDEWIDRLTLHSRSASR